MGCWTGCPSSCRRRFLKKSISARRWQSALVLMSASFAARVGVATGHGAPMASLRLARVRLAMICSKAPNRNILSLISGPPMVPPNCSRWKSVSGLPSEVFALRASNRWKWKTMPWTSLVPDLVITFTTPPAARATPALAPRPRRHHLELAHRLQGDVDRRALAAQLLAEEAVVVIAAVQADVVEDPALSGEGDLVTVGALHDAHPGRQRQKVFELAAQDRRVAHCDLIQRGTGFSSH